MKKILLFLPAISLLTSLGCNKSDDSKRYTMCSSTYGDGRVGLYVLDTYTGKTWFYKGNFSKNQDSNWSAMGTPASVK